MDEEGRLSQEDLDGVADLKIPQPLIQQALETLQSLDPAGVGARSLSECLLLQLARQEDASPLDMEIVRRFLPDLGKKHYGLIARELHVTVEEVRAAEKRIAALDPCPGRSFQPAEPTLYVRPDVFIAELDGKLQVILNDYYLPRVSISQYYVRLLKESDEPETRAYLQQKMQQAKWLLNSLERRGSTLRQCAEAILEAQYDFFSGQSTDLAPMTMVTLAERLHLHPSTISRATREKYLQCRQGTYPLRYFFSRALGEQGPSQQTVKLRLLELIRQEDRRHPLSDQKLAELLEPQGIHIARRTVAKYRTRAATWASAAARRQGAGRGTYHSRRAGPQIRLAPFLGNFPRCQGVRGRGKRTAEGFSAVLFSLFQAGIAGDPGESGDLLGRHLPGLGLSLVPEHVDGDRQDDDRADDNVLDVVGGAHQVQAVADDRHQQRADQRAPDGALAAGEGGAAHDAGRDGVVVIGLAGVAVGGGQTAHGDDARHAGHEAGQGVHKGQHVLGGDAGQAGRLRVAAHAVDLTAQGGPGQEHVEDANTTSTRMKLMGMPGKSRAVGM